MYIHTLTHTHKNTHTHTHTGAIMQTSKQGKVGEKESDVSSIRTFGDEISFWKGVDRHALLRTHAHKTPHTDAHTHTHRHTHTHTHIYANT
jgi:hypothetical protein